VKNEIEKIFVHSISEDTSKYSTMYIRSILLKEIYCTYMINKAEKMSVHNVSENTKECSTMHVRSMLLKAMIIAMQKIHLNKIYFLKDKISQFKSKNLKHQNVKMLIHKDCNVVEKQFNSVVETVDCKQFILHAIVRVLIIHEITYNFSSKFIVEFIKILQQEDKFAVRLKANEMMNI